MIHTWRGNKQAINLAFNINLYIVSKSTNMSEVLVTITVQTLSYDTCSIYTLGYNDFDILLQNKHP